jgi:hypothetical protein
VQRLRDIKSSGRRDIEAPAATGGTAAPFEDIFDTIIACMELPLTPLLLYNLLIHCPAFSNFVLVRADIDALIVPLLEQLYSAPLEHRPRIYLLQARPCPTTVPDRCCCCCCRCCKRICTTAMNWYVQLSRTGIVLGSPCFHSPCMTMSHRAALHCRLCCWC